MSWQRNSQRRKNTRGMTYSQKKRATLDYRDEYFKHNKGFFGGLYFCAYCKKPLTRAQVQVDHIIPLNNPLGQNNRFNLVAACAKCNRDKSDKFDGRVIIGYTSKIADSTLEAGQSAVFGLFYAVFSVISCILRAFLSLPIGVKVVLVILIGGFIYAQR